MRDGLVRFLPGSLFSRLSEGPLPARSNRELDMIGQRQKKLAARARALFPLTTAGICYALIAFFGTWWIGVGTTDMVLLIAGSCVIVLLLSFLLAVLLGSFLLRRQLRAHRRAIPDSSTLILECGRTQPTGWQLKWPGWFPFLQVELSWAGHEEEIATELVSSGRYLMETVTPRARGVFDNIPRRLTIRDGLRFASVSFEASQPREVEIIPASGHGRQRLVLINLVQGDDISNPLGDPTGDRVDMRQYTRGDAPKTILWKVFARSRKLMVKVPERAVAAKPRNCAYLVSMPDDEAAASLGRDIVEGDLLGEGWRFGADGTPGHCRSKAEAQRFLARSGNREVKEAPSGLSRFLSEAYLSGYRSCFVLLGTDPQARHEEVLKAAAQHGLRIVLCLAAERVIAQAPPPWKQWLLGQQPETGISLGQMETLWTHWSGGGQELRFFDRSSGEAYRDVPTLARAMRGKSK